MSVPLALLAVLGLVAISLSFTRRWGRSRWPFHVVISTAIASLAVARIVSSESSVSYEWLALALAGFAAIRALIATFQEPGPRF